MHRTIANLAELDDVLRHVDAAPNDDEMRRRLGGFSYQLAYPKHDPFSERYADFVAEQFAGISGNRYSGNERAAFDLEACKTRPYPYSTQSPTTVGEHLIAIGAMVKALSLPAGASVLDMGCGWGNTTETFGKMGYSVTAVDVDPNFCALVRFRCEGLPVTVVNGGFETVASIDQTFDGVVFFECFHHAMRHVRLLEILHARTTDNAVITFTGEPIGGFDFPWGIRPDGMAIWSVRKFGWLELGFSESYFLEALHRTGWKATRHSVEGCGLATTYRAVKR